MADNPTPQDDDSEEELSRLFREIFPGTTPIDAHQLAGVAGLSNNPELIGELLNTIKSALSNPQKGIDWSVSADEATKRSKISEEPVTDDTRSSFDQTFRVAQLWLAEVSTMAEHLVDVSILTRSQWVARSMAVWSELAEPVAKSNTDALSAVLQENTPVEMHNVFSQADSMMRSIGGSLFSLQLGQSVGELSETVLSGGDIGIPLLPEGTACLIPQNVSEFANNLDVERDEIHLYFATRELAHARLFTHAKWLRNHLHSSITEFARGITIDTQKLEEITQNLESFTSENLSLLLREGSLFHQKTHEQEQALARIETILALIDGWVAVTTAEACVRLPKAEALAEMITRRRATGGPAETAFATLVGLHLRPKKLREAAQLWRDVSHACGKSHRDALWSHPDLLPSEEEWGDHSLLIARILNTGKEDAEKDDVDLAIEDLLSRPDTGDETGHDVPKNNAESAENSEQEPPGSVERKEGNEPPDE